MFLSYFVDHVLHSCSQFRISPVLIDEVKHLFPTDDEGIRRRIPRFGCPTPSQFHTRRFEIFPKVRRNLQYECDGEVDREDCG